LRRFFCAPFPVTATAFEQDVRLLVFRDADHRPLQGHPVVKHLVIPGIRPHLFERWLRALQ